jgi:hypothetical protein
MKVVLPAGSGFKGSSNQLFVHHEGIHEPVAWVDVRREGVGLAGAEHRLDDGPDGRPVGRRSARRIAIIDLPGVKSGPGVWPSDPPMPNDQRPT